MGRHREGLEMDGCWLRLRSIPMTLGIHSSQQLRCPVGQEGLGRVALSAMSETPSLSHSSPFRSIYLPAHAKTHPWRSRTGMRPPGETPGFRKGGNCAEELQRGLGMFGSGPVMAFSDGDIQSWNRCGRPLEGIGAMSRPELD